MTSRSYECDRNPARWANRGSSGTFSRLGILLKPRPPAVRRTWLPTCQLADGLLKPCRLDCLHCGQSWCRPRVDNPLQQFLRFLVNRWCGSWAVFFDANRALVNYRPAVGGPQIPTWEPPMKPNSIPRLTDCEQTYVAQFMRLIQLICDRTKSVVFGYAIAAYIAGRTGTGKTFNVLQELRKHEVPWCYQNARVTAMGLFELFREHPEHIIVLDDVPSIFKDKAALQILLAALDGDPEKPREITYKSKDKDERFEFSGGLILTGNVPIGHDQMARAVAGRVN